MATRKPHRGRKGAGPKAQAAPAGAVGHGEFVVYPGVPGGMYELLERVSAAVGDSPDLGSPGISLDRTRLTLRWYGEPPAELQGLADGAAGFDVVVEQTEFRPGDLRVEAERLVREHAPAVQSASARPTGDGIDVAVPPAAAAAAGGAEAAVAERGVVGRFPLFIEVGSAVPG
jgi:hypothetical protein